MASPMPLQNFGSGCTPTPYLPSTMLLQCFQDIGPKLGAWKRHVLGLFGRDKSWDGIPEVTVNTTSSQDITLPRKDARFGSPRSSYNPSPSSSGLLRKLRDGSQEIGVTESPDRLGVPSIGGSSQHAYSDESTLHHSQQAASITGGKDVEPGMLFRKPSRNEIVYESALREEFHKARIEVPEGSHRYFIPADDLERLVTPGAISKELQERGVNLDGERFSTEFIWKRARNLFALLVYLRCGDLIFDFLEEDIDDDHLPFNRLDKNTDDEHLAFNRSDKNTKAREHKLCSNKRPLEPIRCMATWNSELIHEFGRDQWCVLAPIFDYHDGIEHYELHDNCVTPWAEDVEKSDSAMEGGFGSVCRVRIHPAHQRIRGTTQMLLPVFLAVKRLHSTNEANFKSEVAMLKKLKKRKHAHLVNLLATFRFKSHFYLIFPYAHCNLRQYWQRTPIPDFTVASVSWMLQECKAVASALYMVHESQSTQELAYSSETASDPRPEDDARRYGRHGDIKAENILWFENMDNSHGLLVVADFGLMAFHTKDTRSDVEAKYITGSPSYEPPELQLRSKISRAFDIWSLGCLYLEFVSWLVCGWEPLRRFPEVREQEGPPGPQFLDDTFFTIIEHNEPPTAIVRQTVLDWILDLHELPRASQFVHDFLDLISDRLLVVLPRKRIRMGQLNRELSNMLKHAREDPRYLTDPVPFPPRAQQPHPLSLAVQHRVGNVLPSTRDGVPLPRRLSGILDRETGSPSPSPIRHGALEDTAPPSSPPLGG